MTGIIAFFSASQNKVTLLRWVYWTYDQYPALHSWRASRAWGARLVAAMRGLRRQKVCILVKADEINSLCHMILYVRKNEETSHLQIVHFYGDEGGIPSELEANAKSAFIFFPFILGKRVELIRMCCSTRRGVPGDHHRPGEWSPLSRFSLPG